MDADQQAFLRALRADYLGEIVGEVDHQILALVALRSSVREKAREFAAAEAATRRLLGDELARHGVKIGPQRWLRSLTWAFLLPVKLALPTRTWARVLHQITSHSIGAFERQQARFGSRNPELFAWLVTHEVLQRDWAKRCAEAAR